MIKKLSCGLAMLALTAALGAVVATAAGPYVYTDAVGDSASAPDIQRVTLTDNGNGTVGIAIDLAAMIPADGDSGVEMMIDADRNGTTGDDGFEFGLAADATGAGFGKWDGSRYADFPHQPIQPRLLIDGAGVHLTFVLTLGDIGAQAFDFVVDSWHGKEGDWAPEHGLFAYPSAAPAPTPTTTTAPTKTVQAAATPTITSVLTPLGKLMPKAGSTFAAPKPQLRLATGAVVAPDSMSCSLTLKGKALKPLRACVWTLPKSTKGKTLTLAVTLGYQGATTSLKLPVMPK